MYVAEIYFTIKYLRRRRNVKIINKHLNYSTQNIITKSRNNVQASRKNEHYL